MKVLLRGGRVIDPASHLDALSDVLMEDGLIAAVGSVPPESIDAETQIVDCTGMLVTPGLIDLHVHVMPGLGNFCLEADQVGVRMGVPTLIDGGTSGVATFDLARKAVIDHPATQTKVLAFMDPNQLYLATKDFICHKLEIANDLRNLDTPELAASLERNADVLVGLKVRVCHVGDPEYSPFLAAAHNATSLPVMVHLGRFPHTPVITTSALLKALRPGDVITHAFRGAGGMLDSGGKAIAEFRDAVDRGVRLDTGHSGTDFRFRDARKLFDQGYLPHTISTDLNIFNINGPVFSLAETMTKIWALGVDLVDVIGMATLNPAQTIGRSHELGTLQVGRRAEISVLRIVEGDIALSDGHETVNTDRALVAVGCTRAGVWHQADDLPTFTTAGASWTPGGDDEDW